MKKQINCPICDTSVEVDNEIDCTCPECGSVILAEVKKQEVVQENQEKVESKETEKVDVKKDYDELLSKCIIFNNVQDNASCLEIAKEMVEVDQTRYEGWLYLALCSAKIVEEKINSNQFQNDEELEAVDTYFEKAFEIGIKDKAEEENARKVHVEFLRKNLVHSCDVKIKETEEYIKGLKKHLKKEKDKIESSATTSSANKSSKKKSKKKDRSYIYDDPEPFTFPSDKKPLKILFWVLLGLTALLITCTILIWFKPDFFSKETLQNVGILEIMTVTIGSIILLILTLTWVIYYLIRRFKKVDWTQPTTIKILRYVFLGGLLISLIACLYSGTMVGLSKFGSDIIQNQANTTINFNAETIKLKVFAILAGCFTGLWIILEVINQIRIKIYLNDSKINWPQIFYLIFGLPMFLSLAGVVIFGLFALIDLIFPSLLTLIFGAGAKGAEKTIHLILIICASVFGGTFIGVMITSAFDKDKTDNKKDNKEEVKETKEKPSQDTNENIDVNDVNVNEEIMLSPEKKAQFDENIKNLTPDKIEFLIENFKGHIKTYNENKLEYQNMPDEQVVLVAQRMMKKNNITIKL